MQNNYGGQTYERVHREGVWFNEEWRGYGLMKNGGVCFNEEWRGMV